MNMCIIQYRYFNKLTTINEGTVRKTEEITKCPQALQIVDLRDYFSGYTRGYIYEVINYVIYEVIYGVILKVMYEVIYLV